MENTNVNNAISIIGSICEEPKFSHESYGEKFYLFYVKTKRLSDINDILPVIISERLIDVEKLSKDILISINGQLRSYNVFDKENEKSRLVLQIFVKNINLLDSEENDKNIIELDGYICKPPVYRETPSGREICDLFLAINRNYKHSDYIPTICWGRNANFAKNLSVGDNIKAIGRLQSREYNKRIDENTSEKRIAYEVSISKLELISSRNNDSIEKTEETVSE